MKAIIDALQDHLATIPGIKYVDENWGQLDDYSPNFPVQWPCILIDVIDGDYSNLGKDTSSVPVNRQMANVLVELRIANLRLTNTSKLAPQSQKDAARSIWNFIEEVHKKVHGYSPTPMCGKLIRGKHQRVRRDDGVQEYVIVYSGSINDV